MTCHQVEASALFPHLESSREFSGSVQTSKDWFTNLFLKITDDFEVRACVEVDDNVLCNKKCINIWVLPVFKSHYSSR